MSSTAGGNTVGGGTRIRVGTRGSELALYQTEAIIARMRAVQPGYVFEVVPIVTHGDRFQQKPIAEMGEEVDRGIFNTALEQAVLSGEVHLATCSFKDVESELPAGLRAVSVLPREDHRDVLVSRHGATLDNLPPGAELATSSPRRISQLAAHRPDLRFVPLRGNVPTRVEREAARHDGVVLAAAGLIRLGLQAHVTDWLSEDVLLPAPAQAAMGCQFMEGDERTAALVEAVQDADTELCVRAEKSLLVRLSGGCFAPVGALARRGAATNSSALILRCRIAALDGTRVIDERMEGVFAQPATLVDAMVQRVAAQGGLELVAETRAYLQSGER